MELTREQAIKAVHQCVKKANRLYGIDLKLSDVTFGPRMTRGAGMTYYNGKFDYSIKLSIPFMDSAPEFVKDEIIPHEVAHAVGFYFDDAGDDRGDLNHGPNWKAIAKRLGASGERLVTPPEGQSPKRSYHRYIDTNGEHVDVDGRIHNKIQNEFRSFKTKSGGRIAMGAYQGKIKK